MQGQRELWAFGRGLIAAAGIAVLALLAFAAPAQAEQPDLDLLHDANVRIDGAASTPGNIRQVAIAGDVNDDGRDDVIVGASGANSAYVVYGAGTMADVDLAALGARGFRIDGAAAGDRAGESVEGAGDVNDDGIADVVVGAPNADNNGRDNSGSAYVVYGSDAPDPADVTLGTLGPGAGFRIDGATAGDTVGSTAEASGVDGSVDGAGDVNDDGIDDVIVGAPLAHDTNPHPVNESNTGSAYVVYGSSSPDPVVDLSALGGDGFQIDGWLNEDIAGATVAGAGDVNDDGRDDVLVGAPEAGPTLQAFLDNHGVVYVVYGSDESDPADISLEPNSLGADGFQIVGAAAGEFAGISVDDAGDVNADGRDDLALTARGADGSAYVIYGSVSPDPADIDLASLGARGFRIDGRESGAFGGLAVATAGDVDADNRDDVIVGSSFAGNNGRVQSGSAFVVYGANPPAIVDLESLGAHGFRVDGGASIDRAGFSVAGGGDVAGDGRDDVIVGATLADPAGRPQAGTAYVITGDTDADGTRDDADNCRRAPNANQSDFDGDAGTGGDLDGGDACDPDAENDGVLDGADNCRLVGNSDQVDTDGDRQGDECDGDDDNDSLADGADNCRVAANPDQADLDADGRGDACDADVDGDGVAEDDDNCPAASNPDQADADADGIGDACDRRDDRPAPPDEESCTVPEVKRGSSVRATRDQLEGAGCALGRVTRASHRRVDRGGLIKLKEKPGTVLDEGAAIDAVFSKGRGRR